MNIYVKGVLITLTDDQEAQIKKELAARERCKSSFRGMLIHLGFKELPDARGTFIHTYFTWYAEIIDHGGWNDVWITGPGLKTTGFPGGYIYNTPAEIAAEITNYFEHKHKDE